MVLGISFKRNSLLGQGDYSVEDSQLLRPSAAHAQSPPYLYLERVSEDLLVPVKGVIIPQCREVVPMNDNGNSFAFMMKHARVGRTGHEPCVH